MLIDALILASIWLIFTLPFLIAGRTILPVDWHGVLPTGAYGYHGPRLPHFLSLDPDSASGLDLAGYKYVADSLRNGHIPFWNPYQHFGAEYLADAVTLVLYPFSLLHLILPREYWDLPQFLQFYCAALGLYLLAREFELKRMQAILCGACALASGYLQGFLCVTTLLSGMVWMPFVLLAIERSIRRDSIRPALIPGIIGTFLLGTSCNPGLAVILIFCLSIYAIFRVGMTRNWKALFKAIVPLAIGGLFSAPAVLPFLSNAMQFQNGLGSKRGEHVLSLMQLPALFLPYLYSPMKAEGAFGDPNVLSSSYWPLGWITPPVAFLAISGIAAAIKNRHRSMLVLSGIAIWLWLWCMSVPPFNAVSLIPVVWRLSTGYVMAPIHVITCLLAGYGVSYLSGASSDVWKVIMGFWAAFLGSLIAIAFLVYRNTAKPDSNWVLGSSAPVVLWAVIPMLVLWASVMVREQRRPRFLVLLALGAVIASGIAFFPSGADLGITFWLRVMPLAVFLAIAAVALAVWNHGQLRTVWAWALMILPLLSLNIASLMRYDAWPARYDPFVAPEFVKRLQQDPGAWRSYMTDLLMFPNYSSAFGISSVNILEAIVPYAGANFFGRFLEPYEPPTQIYGVAGRVPGTPLISPIQLVVDNKKYWDYVGVRYIVTSMYGPPLDPKTFELVLRDPPASLWRNNSAQPLLYVAPEAVRVADWQDGQNRFANAANLRRTAYVESGNASLCLNNPAYPAAAAADIADIRIEPNRVYASVNAYTGGTLVLVSNYADGWSARINGARTRVYRVNGAFQGACLAGPGKYQIIFEFEPSLWKLGLLCAGAGVFLLFLFAARSPRQSLKTGKSSE